MMNIEKIKEIKKVLNTWKIVFHGITNADILTYINELESENEKLKQHKRELQGGQQDLIKRIAELEKGNAKLLDSVETVQSNRCVYKCELTKEHLTKFTEMLKEELKGIVGANFIDEILRGFINE